MARFPQLNVEQLRRELVVSYAARGLGTLSRLDEQIKLQVDLNQNYHHLYIHIECAGAHLQFERPLTDLEAPLDWLISEWILASADAMRTQLDPT